MVNLFSEGMNNHTKCISGLPKGTKFVYAIPDTTYGVWMIVEHESFDLLNEGDMIPVHNRVEMEKVECDRH